MECQKMKKYLYRGLSVFMGLYLSLCSCIGSYASDSTSSGASDTWTMNAGTFLELVWQGYAKEVSAPFVVWNDLNGCTFNDFVTWMADGQHNNLLEDGTVVGHGGAGYSRPSDKINNSTEIDVDPELTQYVLNFVQYCTTQTAIGYTECYLTGFDFLDTSVFSNYSTYVNVKYIIEHANGYAFMFATGYGNANNNNIGIITIDRSKFDVNFIGTTTQGVFTNVGLEHNWSMFNQFPTNTDGVDFYCVRQSSGTYGKGKSYAQAAANAGYSTSWVPSFGSGIKNTSSPYNSTVIMSVMTSKPNKELVYVFDTINSYKNYNAGMPQPYYLTSSGMNTGTWTASGGGVINTGSMNNSGNYYSSVTSGIGANWTPDQILALVDKVANANNGSGGSGSSNDDSKWWERIGNAIGNLIDGLVEVLSTVIEKLSEALLSVIHLLTGYTDDNGTVHEGLFGKLLNLVNSGFNNFLASIFSWLPEEIVTLFTAVLVFGIFFGLLKMLRR